ncbi:hypothetical protein J2046_003017 [Rhizobium petrolearium]|uniref:hypothetical protein n=1 Tax=Neorhizobium petrolearium TaxID=515361 RepID=UPI001AE8A3A1|nr:hypothetical protein [Neorhizobium petrolearium]MBP1844750.1 hypothetical protein [Neorhizobium petrolearium]
MTKTFIGIDSVGVPCVKITKGTIDPRTEPDANKSSFFYNSKFAADVKITAIDTTPYSPNADTYWPAGAGNSSYQKKKQAYPPGGFNYVMIRNSYFGEALPYDLPLYDLKYKRLSDGRYVENFRVFTQGGEDNAGREAGYRTMIGWLNNGWWLNDQQTFYGNPPLGKGIRYYNSTFNATDGASYDINLVVWRLPANNVPLIYSVTPSLVPGLRTVEITSEHCRVAKPGYDVRTATPTQLAFDSSGRPLAVIKAGDIALPSGITEIEVGYPVDNSTICDLLQYENNVISYPVSGYFTDTRCEYWFAGTKLYINNLTAACRVRYLVLSNNQLGPTTGSNDVFRQFSEGGLDVVQFLRPGAADPPNFADIVLDSRWPAIQILAEGYQAVASQPNYTPPASYNPGQSFTVNFDGAGFFPFVKYMTVGNDSMAGSGAKAPSARLIENYNNSTRYNAGGSSFCILTGNQATFYTYNGNPVAERWVSGDGWKFDYSSFNITGIRYFILGIPQ